VILTGRHTDIRVQMYLRNNPAYTYLTPGQVCAMPFMGAIWVTHVTYMTQDQVALSPYLTPSQGLGT
jgi:hypothetical protein